MKLHGGNTTEVQAIIDAALRGDVTEEDLRRLQALGGTDAVLVALVAAAGRIDEQNHRIEQLEAELNDRRTADPSTPSAMRPVYTKPKTPRRRKRPGAKKGHPGSRRSAPAKIDRRKEHRLEQCPDCGGALQQCNRTRTRTIEDIPEQIEPEITEHTIHRDYCPACKKHVEPIVPDASSKAILGHRLVALTAWFHYGLGITIEQVVQILSSHLQTKVTPGGMVGAWQRLAMILLVWYEQIGQEARHSATLHADETGWRVAGQTHWLWCFANGQVCYYMIHRSRGSPALQEFFTEAFGGVLITDFWAAYGTIGADDRQYCLVHLLRELEKVDQTNVSTEWNAFAKKLRRLVRDGIRLRHRPDFSPERYARRIKLIDDRLCVLAQGPYQDRDATRLAKRLDRYIDYLFTFLSRMDVPYENNFAERMIRPAVILRKNSQSNRSEKGAATQGVLMSVYRTLRLRGHDPIATLVEALRTYTQTGQLPPLPPAGVADG